MLSLLVNRLVKNSNYSNDFGFPPADFVKLITRIDLLKKLVVYQFVAEEPKSYITNSSLHSTTLESVLLLTMPLSDIDRCHDVWRRRLLSSASKNGS